MAMLWDALHVYFRVICSVARSFILTWTKVGGLVACKRRGIVLLLVLSGFLPGQGELYREVLLLEVERLDLGRGLVPVRRKNGRQGSFRDSSAFRHSREGGIHTQRERERVVGGVATAKNLLWTLVAALVLLLVSSLLLRHLGFCTVLINNRTTILCEAFSLSVRSTLVLARRGLHVKGGWDNYVLGLERRLGGDHGRCSLRSPPSLRRQDDVAKPRTRRGPHLSLRSF